MKSKNRIYKIAFYLVCLLMLNVSGFSQESTSLIKAQFGLGINGPSNDGFVQNYEGKAINFPTISLGLQYMFKPKFGAKLDYSFNRISNLENTEAFKLNYSRVNTLFVYDANSVINFLPPRLGVFLSAGPGYSSVKPLGDYTQNKVSYLNVMGAIEFHYGISDKLSVFTNVSYVNGFAKDFNPIQDGYGSFNGNLFSITFGASISLSGCYFCNQ